MRNKIGRLLLCVALAAVAVPLARADLIDEDQPPASTPPAPRPPKPSLPPALDDEPLIAPPPAAPLPPMPDAANKSGSKAAGSKPPRGISEEDPRPLGTTGRGSTVAPKGGGKKNDKEQAKEPVHFKSNGGRGLREKGMFELLEAVEITQGTMKMEANHAQIFGDEKSKDVLKVIADGDVKMHTIDADSGEEIKAFGDKVVFDNKTRLVVMEGNARLWRGTTLLRGKKIYYEMDTGWIRADRIAGEVQPETLNTNKAKP